MKNIYNLAVVLMAILTLLIPISGNTQPQKVSGGPLKISFPITLSGAYGEAGSSNAAAASQAVAEWNEKGGCLGRPIELLIQDDKGSPEVAVRIAREFINRDKVDILSGCFASSVAMAMSNLARENKIVFGSGTGTIRQLRDKDWSPYTFLITASTDMRSKGLVAGVAKMKKYKRWAVLSPDYNWGRTMWADFKRYYKEIVPDMEIVGEYWPPLGETDYTSYITAVLAAKPDAVQSGFVGGDLVTFVSQAKTHGFFDKTVYVNDNTGDVLALLPFADKYPTGCIGAACYVPYWKSPDNDEFLKRFAKYNADPKTKWRSPASVPGFHYTEAYETISFLLHAIAKAGTTNAEPVIKAGENLTFTMPGGPATMRAFDHQLARPMFVGRTKIVPGYPIVPMVDGLSMVPPNEIMRTIEQTVADGHPGRPDLPKKFTEGMGLP